MRRTSHTALCRTSRQTRPHWPACSRTAPRRARLKDFGSWCSVLYGFQVIDEFLDHRIHFRALGRGIRAREIIEANTPHRHLTRAVRAIFQPAVDRSAHVFAWIVAAIEPREPRQ